MCDSYKSRDSRQCTHVSRKARKMLMNEWDKSMLKIIRASEKGKRLGIGFFVYIESHEWGKCYVDGECRLSGDCTITVKM